MTSMFGVCRDASVHSIRFRSVFRMAEYDEQRGQNVSSCVDKKTTASGVKHERMSAAECGFDDNSRARRESMTPMTSGMPCGVVKGRAAAAMRISREWIAHVSPNEPAGRCCARVTLSFRLITVEVSQKDSIAAISKTSMGEPGVA